MTAAPSLEPRRRGAAGPAVVCLLGPTATGKTALALALRRRFPVDLISVDSVMVYRGMDIGSAKPDAATLAADPHRLIDILDPAERYSAAQFCADAGRHIRRIHERGRTPLLVGGTLLYFRALQHGLSALPQADPQLRERLQQRWATVGPAALHAELAAADAAAARRIHPHDRQRLLRALEVIALSGLPLTAQQSAAAPNDSLNFFNIILLPNCRTALHELIESRFQHMLERGLVDEVNALFQRGDLHDGLPALRSVGYRQVWEYLNGRSDYPTMRQRALSATRQFAKRQLTWLRHQPLRGASLTLDSSRPDLFEKTVSALSEKVFCRI